ncbi:hypothetical protein D3C85_1640060 [compost metagenome]
MSYSAATRHQFDFNAAILGATLGGVVGSNGRAGAGTKGLQARRIDAVAAQELRNTICPPSAEQLVCLIAAYRVGVAGGD